jgi:hypothetical protein
MMIVKEGDVVDGGTAIFGNTVAGLHLLLFQMN